MARLLVYYAHPGHRFSRANREMAAAARAIAGIAFVDLYAEYPRHDIDVAQEQERLLGADAILVQCPLFWYSTPSLVKEWLDLVLEPGFAYGAGGDRLAGKTLMLALTAASPAESFAPGGHQRQPLRAYLAPLEQTARLCRMRFAAPYVLYDALAAAESGALTAHVEGYRRLLAAIRDERYDLDRAAALGVVDHATLPILAEA